MKFICLGYVQPGKFEAFSDAERDATLDTCFNFDDKLKKNGNWGGGEALQPPATAKTVSWKNGKASVTDGPYAETKEQIGGILILEAKNMEDAVRIISEHPGSKMGPFEIRPAADLDEMVRESDQRRNKAR